VSKDRDILASSHNSTSLQHYMSGGASPMSSVAGSVISDKAAVSRATPSKAPSKSKTNRHVFYNLLIRIR